MSDTTNIFDLPTDPAGGGNVTNNINLTASENNSSQQPPNNSQMALDQNTINQIVSGLQQASTTGITQLHSRDIPMTTNAITQDPHIQPNYIPPVQRDTADYINEYEDSSEIINSYNKNANIQNSLDDAYAEIQTPMLLAILYFLFQLPIFKKYLFNFFPVLFLKDGNMNLYGFLFTSTLFGLIFYLLNKITTQFDAF
jgi:hypothetical protein